MPDQDEMIHCRSQLNFLNTEYAVDGIAGGFKYLATTLHLKRNTTFNKIKMKNFPLNVLSLRFFKSWRSLFDVWLKAYSTYAK